MALPAGSKTTISCGSTGGRQRWLPIAKIVIALQDELGRVLTHQEIDQGCLCTRVRHQAVLGLAGRRQQQRSGQLAIF